MAYSLPEGGIASPIPSSIGVRPPQFSLDSLSELLFRHHFTPLTLPNRDLQGRTVQLWKYKDTLRGTLLDAQGNVRFFSGNKIRNPLQSNAEDPLLVERLEGIGLRQWHLSYSCETGEISIFPYLAAAGKEIKDQIDKIKKDIAGLRTQLSSNTLRAGQQELRGDVVKHVLKAQYPFTYRDEKGNTARGNPVFVRRPYLHYDKVQNAQKGLENRLRDLSALYYKTETTLEQKRHIISLQRELKALLLRSASFVHPRAKPPEDFAKRPLLLPYQGPSSDPKPFYRMLHQTKLTESFRASHPHLFFSRKGGSGADIGGVAAGEAYIEGLFDSPGSVFESEHFFCFEMGDGRSCPFTDEELSQILQELKLGIYVHDTIPFFSLHFNQDADLFPVIHPAYRNTLVGRVISMLDYMMKGYLNGAVFKEEFIDAWAKNPHWNTCADKGLRDLIDFQKECERDADYESLRSLACELEFNEVLNESDLAEEFSGFKNSFRIIGKQNSYRKEGPLFRVDSDFDVLYTLSPTPKYKEYVEQFFRKHGAFPGSYVHMQQLFQTMCTRIHDHMPKIPLCRKYFDMFAVINFFSAYFSTLKRHRKVPLLLDPLSNQPTKGSPALFPHLPIKKFAKEAMRADLFYLFESAQVRIETFGQAVAGWIIFEGRLNIFSYSFLPSNKIHVDELIQSEKVKFCATLTEILKIEIFSKASPRFRKYLEKEYPLTNEIVRNYSNLLADLILTTYSIRAKAIAQDPRARAWYLNGQFNFKKFHKKIKKAIRDGLQNFYSLQSKNVDDQNGNILNIREKITYSYPLLKSDLTDGELEFGKRVVGGCGLTMKSMRLQDSPQAKIFWKEHSVDLLKQPDASWKVFQEHGKSLAAFRLCFAELLPEEDPIYDWMEEELPERTNKTSESDDIPQIGMGSYFSSLWASNKKGDMNDSGAGIVDSMQRGDSETFTKLVTSFTREDLKQIKLRSGASLLHIAAMQENPVYVETLLKKGLLADSLDVNGCTPCHVAAMYGLMACLSALLGPRLQGLNAKNDQGYTPVTFAIEYDQVEIVRLLIQKGAAWTCTVEGYNPLHLAVNHGNKEIINLLLENTPQLRAFINENSEEGGTPLMIACERDDPDLLQILIQKGANPSFESRDGVTPLEIASSRGYIPTLNVLVQHAKPNRRTIHAACAQSSVEVIKALKIDADSERNVYDDTPLHTAIRHGNLAVAMYLIEITTDNIVLNQENQNKQKPIDIALHLGFWEIVALLAKLGASFSLHDAMRPKYNPLLKRLLEGKQFSQTQLLQALGVAAIHHNHEAITQILLPRGVDLERYTDGEGRRLVHYLAASDGIYLFKKLMEGKEDLAQRFHGKTLLHIAAENKSERVFHYLLSRLKGNPALLASPSTFHPLLGVLESENVAFLQQMFDTFPETDLANVTLDTQETRPIHIAAKIGSCPLCNLLKDRGADLHATDNRGWSALDYAIWGKQTNVFLQELKTASLAPESLCRLAEEDKEQFETILLLASAKKVLEKALILAVEQFSVGVFTRLLSAPVSEKALRTAVLSACKSGRAEILLQILEIAPLIGKMVPSEGDSPLEEHSPLEWAAKKGHTWCVHLLKELQYPIGNASIYAQNHRAITSVLNGQNKDYQFIMKSSFDILGLDKLPDNEEIEFVLERTSFWSTPIQFLLKNGAKEKVKNKIKQFSKDFDPNWRDSRGRTLAHLLVSHQINPMLLAEKLDFSAVHYSGVSLTHAAAVNMQPTILEEILASAPHLIESRDRQDMTPLFYALEAKTTDNLALLIRKGAQVNHYSRDRLTPLFICCSRGLVSFAYKLLQAGANPNALCTNERVSPLQLVLTQQNVELFRLLLDFGADTERPFTNGDYPVHLASEIKNPLFLRLLAGKGAVLSVANSQGLQPVHYAASSGNSMVVEELLNSQWEDSRLTPLQSAAQKGQIDTVERLLLLGQDPEEKAPDGADLLQLISSAPAALSLIEKVSQYKFSREPDRITGAIQVAIQNDSLASMVPLFDLGLPIRADIIIGNTALHLACMHGALFCTQWLLENGLNPSAPNAKGKTAYELAAKNGSWEQFKLLIEYTSYDVNDINTKQETLLHFAVRKKNGNHAAFLLSKGAFVDPMDDRGNTPLYYALAQDDTAMIQLLLGMGADPRLLEPKEEKVGQIYTNWMLKFEEVLQFPTPLLRSVVIDSRIALLVHFQREIDFGRHGEGEQALELADQTRKNEIFKLLLQQKLKQEES